MHGSVTIIYFVPGTREREFLLTKQNFKSVLRAFFLLFLAAQGPIKRPEGSQKKKKKRPEGAFKILRGQ